MTTLRRTVFDPSGAPDSRFNRRPGRRSPQAARSVTDPPSSVGAGFAPCRAAPCVLDSTVRAPMPHHTPLIAMLVAGFMLAFALGALAQRLRLSPLAGYLLTGVIVGPFTPGYVADQSLAQELAEVGVILLMFAQRRRSEASAGARRRRRGDGRARARLQPDRDGDGDAAVPSGARDALSGPPSTPPASRLRTWPVCDRKCEATLRRHARP